mmetsp:Transcript_17437/g.29234  ORF Transcript_17437/g.29234 Transcript_17437/m.29234 type:complete len:547 (+) Transcript_17437:88-1728(+)
MTYLASLIRQRLNDLSTSRLVRGNLVEEFQADDVTRLHRRLSRGELFLRDNQSRHSHPSVLLTSLWAELQLTPHEEALILPFFSLLPTDTLHCSFHVFSFYLWNFCTLDEAGVTRLAFGVLNPARSEVVCDRHMLTVLKALSPCEFQLRKRQLYEALCGVQHNAHTFSLFCKEYSFMMRPLLKLQDELRQGLLGDSFWRRHRLLRASLARDRERRGMDDDEEGLLSAVIARFNRSKAKHLEASDSSKGLFLQVLKRCSASVLEAPLAAVQHKVSTVTVPMSEASDGGSEGANEPPMVCKRCSSVLVEHQHSHRFPASPSKLRATLIKRGGSQRFDKNIDRDAADDGAQREHERVATPPQPVLSRAHSATVLMLQQDEESSQGPTQGCCWQQRSSLSSGLLHDHDEKFSTKNNIYCLQAQQFFLSRDQHGHAMDMFWSCSSLSDDSDADKEEEEREEERERGKQQDCRRPPLQGRLGGGRAKKMLRPPLQQPAEVTRANPGPGPDPDGDATTAHNLKGVSQWFSFLIKRPRSLLASTAVRVQPEQPV